jgi:hypothetical protein
LFLVTNSYNSDDVGAKFLRNIGSSRATWRNIPEDGILHSHRGENLKSYKVQIIQLHPVYNVEVSLKIRDTEFEARCRR